MKIPPKKVLLFSPPGGLWLRGESRCEQNLDLATAYSVTPPTTLCYMATILKQQGMEIKLVDCPVEKISWEGFESLLRAFSPDMALLNGSFLNLYEDLKAFSFIRKICPKILNGLILQYFQTLSLEDLRYDFGMTDFLITGEMEAVAFQLGEFLRGERPFEDIQGIIAISRESGRLRKHSPIPDIADLDSLPLPDRSLLRNNLYLRPDVARPLASIVDGRGCPSNCIFCLAPLTTGRKIRKRSPQSVVREIEDCVLTYGIRDFLFRADAFTIRRDWVFEFCALLQERNLGISWAANSKTTSFDERLGVAMRKAGCFLIQFGMESGSDETLRRIRKGATVADSIKAVQAARNAGILALGSFIIGFPWETMTHLHQTERQILTMGLDFIEIQLPGPYKGTELYRLLLEHDLAEADSIGHDMVLNPAIKGTLTLSRETLVKFRSRIMQRFYFRPNYLFRTLKRISSLTQLAQYGKYGINLVLQLTGLIRFFRLKKV